MARCCSTTTTRQQRTMAPSLIRCVNEINERGWRLSIGVRSYCSVASSTWDLGKASRSELPHSLEVRMRHALLASPEDLNLHCLQMTTQPRVLPRQLEQGTHSETASPDTHRETAHHHSKQKINPAYSGMLVELQTQARRNKA